MELFTVIFLFIMMLFFPVSLSATDLRFDFRKHMRHIGPKEQGFLFSNFLRLPFSFSHNQSRLGITSGNYFNIAVKLKSALHYRYKNHDWSTGLFIAEGYSMTPSIKDRWIKSNDLLRFETRYLYNVLPWFSLFAHARLETSIFKNINIHESEKTYELRNVNNKVRERIKTAELKISDPFKPLFFQENLGIAIGILEEEYLIFEAKSALAFRQTIADNQRIFLEIIDQTRIVRDLQSFYQIGILLGTAIGGKLFNEKVEYSAGVDITQPFWQYPRSVIAVFLDSLIIESSAGASINLNDWSSLEYRYTAIRFPDILADFQQHHLINITLKLDWIYRFAQSYP
jgi:hypothetical protein